MMIKKDESMPFHAKRRIQVFKEYDFSKELEDVKGNYFYSKRMILCTL